MKARIQGVASQMKPFDFFFGVSLGQLILRHSDNLSRSLQAKDLSAAEGQAITAMTVKTLESLRNDEKFKLFFKRVTSDARDHGVSEACLLRRRKVPRRLDEGSAEHSFPASVDDHYQVVYYEALDLITSCIKDRCNQPGYQVYAQVEAVLMKAAKGQPHEEELKSIPTFY